MALNNFEPNVMGGMPGFSGFNSGFGGIAPVGLVGLNNLFDRDRHGDCDDKSKLDLLAALEAAGARKDLWEGVSSLKDSVCGIKDTIANAKDGLDSRICNAEHRISEAAHRAEVRDLESRAAVFGRIGDFERNHDENICDVKKEILQTNFNLEKVNTHLTHLIDKSIFLAEKNKGDIEVLIERKFAHAREAELKDELDRERRCRHRDEDTYRNNVLSDQIKLINSNLFDFAQNQKAAQQSFQFGTGLVNGQSSNTNQVRT